MPEPKLYEFSTHIGAACARKMINFQQLSEKLKMDVTDLMRQCHAKIPPSKAIVKGLAKELGIPRKARGAGSEGSELTAYRRLHGRVGHRLL
jgi:ribosome-binding protein aMBF1 (putative translation factor)